jgi:hypothetical protein
MAENAARRRHWEEELLAEYLAQRHPDARVMTRVRLGPPMGTGLQPGLSEAEQRLVGAAFRRWADALIIEPGLLTIVEAAMMPDPGDTSRVLTYMRLLDSTPELEEFRAHARRGMVLWAVDDPFARQIALEAGFAVEIFRPSNFMQWISTTRARETGKARAPRQVLLT